MCANINIKWTLFLLTCILCVRTSLQQAKQPNCVLYGVCNTDDDGNDQNCDARDQQAKELTDPNAINIFKKRCSYAFPELVENGKIEVCCEEKMLQAMEKNLKLVEGAFKRCSTCFDNLILSICRFTCSPNKSDFVEIVNSVKNQTSNEIYVNEVNVKLSSKYMKETYDSCKEVSMPQTGKYAMEMVCGKPPDLCDYKTWFEFMGTKSSENKYVPFQINYIPVDEEDDPNTLYISTIPCSQSYNESRPACSCMDCSSSCAIGEAPIADEDYFLIANLFGIAFICAIVLFCLGTMFILVMVYIKKRRAQSSSEIPEFEPEENENEETIIQSPQNCISRFGNKINKSIESFFKYWGTLMAKNNVLVIAIASWVILGLGYGAFQLQITTNPVELWASPTSRSRVEKDFFESRFRPFYRTEQIFLKSLKLPKIPFNVSDEKTIEFGSAFHPDFIKAVLKLQEKIEAIGVNTSYALKNLCFSPMSNEFTGPATIEQCTVQSIFGYFKENRNQIYNIDTDDDVYDMFYTTMYNCLESPYKPACLASYGGPVEPAIALGGFKDNYYEANALVLTFLIDNYVKADDLVDALEWETKFIDLLKE